MALAYLLATWLAGPAMAAPLPVHALTVADPARGEQGELLAKRVGWLLGTEGYVIVSSLVLEGRIGESKTVLRKRCAADVHCWRETGREAGLEQIVLIDQLDDETFGLRIVDVGADTPFRQGTSRLTGGWPDPGLVEQLFQGQGALRIDGLPETAAVQIDGGPELPAPHGITIDPVTVGKHTLEFTAEAYEPLFVTLMVYPEQDTTLTATMAPVQLPPPKPKVGWVGAGVVVVAAVIVVAGAGGGLAGVP